ncbi:MAG: AIR synthase related protein [Lentisphaeria bacterium]|jgi:hydrogenase maturation factor
MSHSADQPLPVGKASPEVLKRLLALAPHGGAEVILGPAYGEDAAVLRLPPGLLAVTTDPITFPTPKPGWYAVHINANDLAVTGAEPRWFTLTLLLPPGSTEARLATLMREAVAAAAGLGVTLVGGHTEITPAVTAPVVSATMFGPMLREEPVRTGGGHPGDAVIQLNPLGIEGTSVLAEMCREKIAGVSQELLSRAAAFREKPGLSIVKPALAAVHYLPVSAMHDPTEGGLATGLRELAAASHAGLEIRADALLIRPETIQACHIAGCHPLGLLSSGCLLLTLPETVAPRALLLFRDYGFPAAVIGRLTDRPRLCELVAADGSRQPLPEFARDELARLA